MTGPVLDFIPCEFICKRQACKALVRWTRLDETMVSIQLPGRGAQSSALRGRTWRGISRDAERAQKYLATLEEIKIGQAHDYTLTLKPRGKKVLTLKWSADMETGDLREVRVLLEQVGHLSYAESLAYREQALGVGSQRLYEPGIAHCRTGIRTLGNAYLSEELIDNSETLLALAGHLQAKGALEAAWTNFRNVLESRLSAYQQRYQVIE